MRSARSQRQQIHHSFQAALDLLQPREAQVVRLVGAGFTSKEIARRLKISPLTVRKHRENAMRKLGLHRMADLIRMARA